LELAVGLRDPRLDLGRSRAQVPVDAPGVVAGLVSARVRGLRSGACEKTEEIALDQPVETVGDVELQSGKRTERARTTHDRRNIGSRSERFALGRFPRAHAVASKAVWLAQTGAVESS